MTQMLSFRVDEADLARVDELARLHGVSRSEYLRRLVARVIWQPAIVGPLVSVASYAVAGPGGADPKETRDA